MGRTDRGATLNSSSGRSRDGCTGLAGRRLIRGEGLSVISPREHWLAPRTAPRPLSCPSQSFRCLASRPQSGDSVRQKTDPRPSQTTVDERSKEIFRTRRRSTCSSYERSCIGGSGSRAHLRDDQSSSPISDARCPVHRRNPSGWLGGLPNQRSRTGVRPSYLFVPWPLARTPTENA